MKSQLNPFSIISSSVKTWRNNFWKILLATIIVTIPGSFIKVFQFDSVNDASIVASIAGLYLCVALIWSFFNLSAINKNSFLKLYILSSSRFLPYLFTSVLFAIVCMPAIFSIMLMVLSVSLQIPWAFSIVAIFTLIASIYLAVRLSIAPILVVQNDITAFNALRLSWQVVKGNIIKITFAWAVALFGVIVISGIIFTLVNLNQFMASSAFVQLLLNGILLSLLLPLFIGYGVELVKRLEK